MKRIILSIAVTFSLFGYWNPLAAISVNVVDSLNSGAGVDEYFGHAEEYEKAFSMARLPLGNIQAKGWLQNQLDMMADGQVGHLTEISSFLQPDSGWLGGEERGWEEAPYWFRGFYDLTVLTGDKRMQKIADQWIEALVASSAEDGYYGSDYNRLVEGAGGATIVDLWPHMVMNDALISHYEATGDERIIPMLTKFFAFCDSLSKEHFLPQVSWDYYENYKEHFGDWKPRIQFKRAGDFVPQIQWLYSKTGEPWLIDLAVKVYHRTQPEMNQWLDNHTVHFAQRFRYPAQMYPITGDKNYVEKTKLYYDGFMKTWGQFPRGAHAADERIRAGKIDARQAIETCTLGETNKSHYVLARITGETIYGDRAEDMTFNHLPASHRPDHKSIRYLTASNMPYSVAGMDFKNSGSHPVFTADTHRCCQHNNAQSWPGFVKNMWQATPDNGIVAWLYGPNTMTAKIGEKGYEVSITSETKYPFGNKVVMTVNTKSATEFPLYLRIPSWCDRFKVNFNGGGNTILNQGGKLVQIDRNWKNGDRIELDFNMEVTATRWPRNGAVSVDRGPLTYSIRIKENWEKVKDDPDWPQWVAKPASPWNYGLLIDPTNPVDSISVSESPEVAYQPWTEAHAPVVLKVPARQITDWKARIMNTVDSVRESPVKSEAPTEIVEMIPMGSAHLRMTVLPVVSDRRDARKWADIPNPDEYMLDRLDK